MYLCSGCEQYAYDRPKYAILHHSRLKHPAREYFERRFCSSSCASQFMARQPRNSGPFVLLDWSGEDDRQSEPLPPRELAAMLSPLSSRR